MDSREDRLADEGEWLAEEFAEFRTAYALDADEIPERWQDYPDSWTLAISLDRLSEDLVTYVRHGFERPPAHFAERWEALSSRMLVSHLTKKRRELRDLLLSAMHPDRDSSVDDSERVGAEDGVYEVAAADFLEELLRLKLGVVARDWSLGRLVEVAELNLIASTERSQAFLHQAITRYVSNSRDLMIALPCRAVLEAELAHKYSERDVLRAGNARGSRHVKLADYITHAWRTKAFETKKVKNAALAVKDGGDDTAHEAPNTHNGGEALTNLSTVLTALRQEGQS